ncbi:hypothetical protein Raf01_36570 [Rugosimonospora africana]|uniref:Uncharacterized protein n=1 Tax=Rugosimonospora africana TaxID=556532 RepID=A0A8J3QTG0_9ACTN|nr:hypothetical protein Raf01_36570 [Rugosimonospora africana]
MAMRRVSLTLTSGLLAAAGVRTLILAGGIGSVLVGLGSAVAVRPDHRDLSEMDPAPARREPVQGGRVSVGQASWWS